MSEVIDVTDLLSPEPIELSDIIGADREQMRDGARSPRVKRDTPSQFWHAPVGAGERHIDFGSVDSLSRQAQAKLAAVLKGAARTRIIRHVAAEALAQVNAGKRSSQFVFGHDAELQDAVTQHAQSVYDQARQQTKAEIDRQVGGSHAAVKL
jgi:hypothetical protein